MELRIAIMSDILGKPSSQEASYHLITSPVREPLGSFRAYHIMSTLE